MFRTTFATLRRNNRCFAFSSISKKHCYLVVVKKIIKSTFLSALKKNSYLNLFVQSGFVTAGCCFSKATSRSESPLLAESNERYSEHLPRMDESISEENVDSAGLKRNFTDRDNENNFAADDYINKRLKTADPACEQPYTPVPPILQKFDEQNEIDEALLHQESDHPTDALPEKKKKINQKKKQIKQRPNYFVAVKISNTKIHDALKEVQDHILKQDQYMKPIMIGLSTLHITLMVMHIADLDTHQRALSALEQVKNEYDERMCQKPLELEIKGLGNFRNKVLFAKITNDDAYSRLCDLADSVNQHFEAASVPSTDSRKEFNPHLTIAKITFDRKCRSIKKIKPSLYSSYDDQYFGHQTVKSIQLLSMTNPKDVMGYYSGDEFFFSAFTPVSLQERRRSIEERKEEIKKSVQNLMKNIT